jgi:hypothetical protein
VVTRIDAEEKTAGGIIIPDTAKEKPTEGEVIAVGPGGRDESGEPPTVQTRRMGRSACSLTCLPPSLPHFDHVDRLPRSLPAVAHLLASIASLHGSTACTEPMRTRSRITMCSA